MESDEVQILEYSSKNNDNPHNNEQQQKSKRIRKPKAIKKDRPKGAPIPWCNAYILYVRERRSGIAQSGQNNVDLRKVIAEDWRNLSSDERKPYVKASEMDRIRYHRELEEFKRKIANSDQNKIQDKQQKTPDLPDPETNDDVLRSNSTPNDIDHQETNENLNTSSNSGEKIENDVKQNQSLNQEKIEVKIFTDEFIEHNRIRQIEINDLRKTVAEYEFQNAKLSRLVENVQIDIDNVQNEISVQQSENHYLNKLIRKMHEELKLALIKSHNEDLIEISKIADKNSFLDALNEISSGRNDKLNKKLIEVVSKMQLIDVEPNEKEHSRYKRDDQDDYFDGNTSNYNTDRKRFKKN